jgi:Spy/CpxP family protein refolding chaperone
MRILIATLATTLAATALIAHERGEAREGRRGPGTDAIQGALNLSDEQVTALKQNNQDLREAMKAVFQDGAEKHKALKAELQSANPNPTIIGQMVLDAHAAREKASAMRAEYRDKALAVLDAQQKTALTSLSDAKENRPALFQAGMLNLVDAPHGAFGRGMPHGPRRGFTGPRG